jgi:N-acetylglucosaminyldiphosphoundecaprenol N-acetyl-beta-D-mannosaminyltransferase
MNARASSVARICDIPVHQVQVEEVLRDMEQRIQAHRAGGYISITNTESMYHAMRVPAHMDYIQKADFSLCDGVGVIAAGWAWGHRISRVNGPILQLEASRYGVERGWRHFFYGGKEGVAEEMAARLKAQFPGLQVVGSICPPFRELSAAEDDAIVAQINAARPDIVWVGLGLLKQERWIAAHLGRINAPWMSGVGAAFDYHSGAVPWAPAIIRSLGLEWLFRLIVQPRLRAKRYWWSAVFVLEAFVGRLTSRQRTV